MIFIYFLYGLSFFALGISLLVYPKKGSEFVLAKTLTLIALFGIFHGIHEWAHMFYIIKWPAESRMKYLEIIDLITLSVSYLFLVVFGTKNIYMINNKNSALKSLSIILPVIWIIITAVNKWHFLTADIWARYLLGAPGIFLTSYALILQLPFFENKQPAINLNLKISAGAFFLYGIFGGLIVPKAGFFPASFINNTMVAEKLGVPIEAVRTFCALLIAYNMTKVLNIFNWETKEKLRELSLHDDLTGLLNRRGFFTLAKKQLEIAKRLNKEVLLHSADLDNLKGINDTFGHKEGDLVLTEIANILKESFRESDIVARVGGDEFLILQLENIDANLDTFTARFQKNIEMVCAKKIRNYKLSISIGTLRCKPDNNCSIEDLIIGADKLMYDNKRSKSR